MATGDLENGQPAYHISRDWYESRERSLEEVLAARMCGSHEGDSAAAPARRRAVPDPATGEIRFVAESDAPDPFETIAYHCATQSDFITPMLPLMEAVFRVFLAKNNAPLTAEEIHDELRAWFAGSTRSRYFTIETIARLLENDQHYGIVPHAVGVGAE
jgi:hypothetical protein